MSVASQHVDRYARRHAVNAVPAHVQATLLRMSNVTWADILDQVLTDAGPGTESDRASTLKSVVQLRPQVPVSAICDRLQPWRFNMARFASLRVMPPDRCA